MSLMTHVVGLRGEQGERLGRRRCALHERAGIGERLGDELAPVVIVVDDEDAQAGEGTARRLLAAAAAGTACMRTGSVTVNVAPCPTPSLSPSTVPPCASTR